MIDILNDYINEEVIGYYTHNLRLAQAIPKKIDKLNSMWQRSVEWCHHPPYNLYWDDLSFPFFALPNGFTADPCRITVHVTELCKIIIS